MVSRYLTAKDHIVYLAGHLQQSEEDSIQSSCRSREHTSHWSLRTGTRKWPRRKSRRIPQPPSTTFQTERMSLGRSVTVTHSIRV